MQLPTCIAIVGMDVLLINFLIMFVVAMYQSSYRVSTFDCQSYLNFWPKLEIHTQRKLLYFLNSHT